MNEDARRVARQFAAHDDLAAKLLVYLPPHQDGAHDLGHIVRVWRNVRSIMASEGGDPDLLVAATILHDCVNVPKDSEMRAMASRLSARHAATALTDLGWPRDRISAVSHAIETHSFSAGLVPKTLEARILQDGDRLDAIGHVGLARCFYVSGALGRSLYDLEDPWADDRALDDHTFTLDHFGTKLLKLAEGFQTPTGRALARDRHAQMERFLAGLADEIGP